MFEIISPPDSREIRHYYYLIHTAVVPLLDKNKCHFSLILSQSLTVFIRDS